MKPTCWDLVPQFDIDLKDLTYPSQICDIFKERHITKYVYRIKYHSEVIKFGMSTPGAHRVFGERLYRQVGHMESWGEDYLAGSSGSDWLVIEKEYKKRYGVIMNHNNITIRVYDFSNYSFETIHPDDEVYAAEQSLIRDYKCLVGSKPIGNLQETIDDPFTRRKITVDTFTSLFVT